MNSLFFILFAAAAANLASGNVSITFPQKSEPQTSLVQEIQKELENMSANEMVHHVANIGLKTLRDLLTGHSNIILSPLNIYACLGILDLGSAGETKEELRRILGPPNVNQSIKEIVGVREGISYASAVFLDYNFVPKTSFVDSAVTDYEASVLGMNASLGEEAKDAINRWASEHTNGTIENIIQGRLDPNTKMIILSALLFKGKWLHSFPKESTTLGKFEVNKGVTVDVHLMHLLASVPVVKNVHFDAISLPYQGEEGMTMHLILPKLHGTTELKKLLSHLNANSLKKLRTELTVEEVFIVVPKLKVDARMSLTNSLKTQGVGSMFNPAKANFSEIVDNESGLYVSEVYHSIHFEIDEEGTLGSAVTTSMLTKSSRFVFLANRPFIFVITDASGLVLFMGAIINPN